MNFKTLLTNQIIWLLFLLPISPSLAADRLTLSAGTDYSTGKYGSSTSTDIWYLPISIKLESSDLVYKLTVPYLQITGPGNVIGVDANPGAGNHSEISSESGLGDIIAAISYSLTPYQPERLFLEITGKVKFPTADENKMLGTGEYDYSMQADGLYSSGKASTFVTLGYKILGDPPGTDYQNVIYSSLGGMYTFSRHFSTGLVYDSKQASTTNGIEQEELTVFINTRLADNRKMLFYAVKGLSDGSPDWGVGINFSYIL